VQDQLPSVEESEDEDVTMDEEGELFKIPESLDPRHRRLLDATPLDFENRTVRELKCRLCPNAGFINWYKYRRHCDEMEVHPHKISFCRYCGDFFARNKTLRRH
jgi:hypothetical protein